MPKVSFIIPTMPGREHLLTRLILSIPSGSEIIVVDDNDLLLAAKRNKGASKATGEYLFFIDDDNYLDDFSLNEIDTFFTSYNAGVMGAVACYDDKKEIIADGGSKRNYLSGFMLGINTNKNIDSVLDYYEVDEVANAFVIPRDVFDAVGGFDEENFPIDLDEADICKRIKNMGYKIMMNSLYVCYHNSQTYSPIPDFRRPMNAYFMGRNKLLYQIKHLTKKKLAIYFIVFMPLTVLGYAVALTYRRKPWMFIHFLRGVLHAIQGRRSNRYQKR